MGGATSGPDELLTSMRLRTQQRIDKYAGMAAIALLRPLTMLLGKLLRRDHQLTVDHNVAQCGHSSGDLGEGFGEVSAASRLQRRPGCAEAIVQGADTGKVPGGPGQRPQATDRAALTAGGDRAILRRHVSVSVPVAR